MDRAMTRKIVRVEGQQVTEMDDLIVSEYAVTVKLISKNLSRWYVHQSMWKIW